MPTPTLRSAVPRPTKIGNPGGINERPPSVPNPAQQTRPPRQSPSVNGGITGRPPQPPPPAGGGHYTWVNGKGWQLIHATGPGQWRPGPPQVKPPPNPSTSSYGLSTSSKSAFNPYGMPRTVGAFNQEVIREAQPQFQPQLQGIQGQESSEQQAAKLRQADIGSIYDQYGTEAQKAFNEVQAALKDLAVQNAGSDQTAQANLAAALGSSGSGEGSLAQMMGMSAPGGGALPYESAAKGAAAATEDQRAGLTTGTLAVPGESLANVPLERATQENTESLRHGAAMQGLENQKGALEQQIPGIIETARQNLINNLLNAQDLRFQQGLATKQFGLSAQAQKFNQGLQNRQFKETQVNDASNRRAQAAQIQQNAQALVNQQQATRTAGAQALAKAQGQQQANAIKYLTSWLQPQKSEMTTKTILDPNGGGSRKVTSLSDPGHWHRDVGSALRSLMGVYGLNEDQALQIMIDVGGNTYVSGQGGQTVAGWAMTYKQRKGVQNTEKTFGGMPTLKGGVWRVPGGGTLTRNPPRPPRPTFRG